MKKKIILGLLMVITASGMVFVGCDLFETKDSGSTTYEPLIIRGKSINGEDVEIVISTTRTRSREVLTPQNGDSYVLRKDGVVISSGKIEIDEIQITFIPDNGERPFLANYTRGDDYITLYEIPDENGDLTTGLGTTNPGTGSAGGGSARPSYDITARTPTAVIDVFGGKASAGGKNDVVLAGDTERITANVAMEVPISVKNENSDPVQLIINPRREVMITGSGSLTVEKDQELELTGGGTLRIAGVNLNINDDATLTVANGTTLIITNEGRKPASLDIGDGGVLAVEGGDIDIYTKVDVGTTDPGIGTPPDVTMSVAAGNVNVFSGGTLTIARNGTFELGSSGRAVGSSRLNISGTGKVIITEEGEWEPKVPNTDPNPGLPLSFDAVTIRGSGEFTVPSGDNADELNAIISKIKKIDRASNYQGKVVVQLTKGFYDSYGAGATTFIKVDAPTLADNVFPYTINGLGKNSDQKIQVGMLLANNNITLKDVNFSIAINDNNVPPVKFGNGSYRGAVVIARSRDGETPITAIDGEAFGAKAVTIDNCNLLVTTATAGFSAGIYIYGDGYWGGKNIVINKTDVDITGYFYGAPYNYYYPVQALAIHRWEPIVLTGNKLYAKYGANGRANSPNGAPASAFYVNAMYESSVFSGTNISGNTFSSGENIPEQFSFFVNAWLSWDKWVSFYYDETDPHPLLLDPPVALLNSRFGSVETEWWRSSGGVHKQLYDALVSNITDKGFGAFLAPVYYDLEGGDNDWLLEFHKFDGGIKYISFWGYKVTGNPAKYTGILDAWTDPYPRTDYKGGFDPNSNDARAEATGNNNIAAYRIAF